MITRTSTLKRALATSTALAVATLGATAAPAAADPGNGNGHGQDRGTNQGHGHGKAKGHNKGNKGNKGNNGKPAQDTPAKPKKDTPAKPDHPGNSGQPDKPSKGDQGDQGNQGTKPGQKKDKAGTRGKGAKADPPGNNGTVKITPYDEMDGIPQNSPHQSCVFDVEWYGFDEGDDIWSTVTFEAWAPTRGTLQVVEGDSRVFVGDDPASGAGVGSDADGTDADNGFDGEETYRLAFPGIEPHPQQGYHVKLTIHTPGSQGADTKHKVFWVQPCETTTPGDEGDEGTPDTPGDTDEGDEGDEETPETPEVAGEQATTDDNDDNDSDSDVDVLGEQATAPQGEQQAAGEQGALPTAVDAGLAVATRVATSPVGLPAGLITLAGLVLAGLALLRRRRA